MDRRYDLVVIGSGPAGHTAAVRAAQLGLKTAVVERNMEMLGGVCLNEGCIPAKSLYRSAKIFDLMRANGGLFMPQACFGSPNLPDMVRTSRTHAANLKKGLEFLFRKNGIDIIEGSAAFLDPTTVNITSSFGEKDLKAGKILVAAGSYPKPLPGTPFDGRIILDSSGAIRLEKVPEDLLIVGGGAIGTEFASFFAILGARVTLVEAEETLLPAEDREIGRRLGAILSKRGVNVVLSAGSIAIKIKNGRAEVDISSPSGGVTGVFDKVIVSIGRIPSTAALGLENAGIEADDRAFIPVDEEMRARGGIYAAGDVVRSPLLAHMASAEGEVAAISAAGEKPAVIDYTSIPSAMYGEVQTSSVGITEEEAVTKGIDHRIGKQFFKANGRAAVNLQTEGFVKVIADASTRKILGAHIIGYEAAELIHEFALAKRAGLTIDDIVNTVHAHPTFSETAVDACRAVFGKAIHG
ncbi:MAG: dihydrolipoyl dehydrogenase [Candidatus Omnitrophica bacterium]|nr:dihydrolipoyl dehydrogenase [Candidatus Omnitrophota bacterium]MDD4012871.1 dihydrolipoyl dehydrogenase [Candidatus Omnitrophota bacterium]